ncbi:MAG: hypothetical protein AAF802_22840 [Planctomycetota bacterium]
MTEPIAHSDKYNDPRATTTRRGILIGFAVVVFGVSGAALSIWSRRTRLEKTTEFWGPNTITALQLAEEVELIPDPMQAPEKLVRISGLPGLGHLRHVLLDERSYDWESGKKKSLPIGETTMVLRLTDPSEKRFPEQRLVIDLETGKVGHEGGGEMVQLNERFQSAMPNFLKQIADFEPLRVENQKEKD